MKKANRKVWIFCIGMILFALGFWTQPILVALGIKYIIVGIVGVISIAGLVAAILMVEPHKAKLRRYYPLALAGIIMLELILQVLAKIIFQ